MRPTGFYTRTRASRTLRLSVVFTVIVAVAMAWSRGGAAQSTTTVAFNSFIDDFVAGGGGRGGGGGTYSAEQFAAQAAATRSQLERLHAIDRAGLSADEQIDWRFAESILLGRQLAQERMQNWKRDPRVYMSFRPISNAIGRPGDPAQKAADLLRLLKAIPTQLDNGIRNVAVDVPRFRELSVFMAQSVIPVFDAEVPAFAATVPAQKSGLLEANSAARGALDRYIAFLQTDLPKRPNSDFAIGKDTYDLMLKQQFMLPYDSDSLYTFAWQQFDKTVAELEAVARKIDPARTWQQIAEQVKGEYPDPAKMIEAHQEWVDKAGQHIKSKDLIPIPWPERVDVVPRAEYLRKTSYYGNSARAQEKDGVFVGEWQINPFEPQWDDKTKHEYLLEHDWGVIIVTAPHETYGGHHVQGLYQIHNPRKLRRSQSISIFSEGWGLYNEQLMQETGFFPNERIHLRQLQLRLWRNARVVWDVGIHTGKMTYDEAVSLLSDRVGFLRWAAELEVDASAEEPGYRIGYFMGMSEILKMREEFKQRTGARFSLKDFHQRLLEVGSMPPTLMREGLLLSLNSTH